jgi:hypothetical protein
MAERIGAQLDLLGKQATICNLYGLGNAAKVERGIGRGELSVPIFYLLE